MNQNQLNITIGRQGYKTFVVTLFTVLLCASSVFMHTADEVAEYRSPSKAPDTSSVSIKQRLQQDEVAEYRSPSKAPDTSSVSIKQRLQQHVRNASEWIKNAIDTVTKEPRKNNTDWILDESSSTVGTALVKAHRLDLQTANTDHLRTITAKDLLPIIPKLTIDQIEKIISFKSGQLAQNHDKAVAYNLQTILDRLTPEQAEAILNSQDKNIQDILESRDFTTLRNVVEYRAMGRKSQNWIDYIKNKESENPENVIKHLKKASQADLDNATDASFNNLSRAELAVVGAKLSPNKMKTVVQRTSNKDALLSSFDALYTALPHLTPYQRAEMIEAWRSKNKFSVIKFLRLALKHVSLSDSDKASAAA